MAFGIVAAAGVLGQLATAGAEGRRVSALWVTANVVVIWGLFALLSPLALWTTRRFPLARRSLIVPLAAHFVTLLIVSFMHTIAYNVVVLALGRGDVTGAVAAVRNTGVANLRYDVFVYSLLVGGYLLFAMYRKDREREDALATARLEALTSRLQPHFLFNTLNAISTLVLRGERDTSVAMIARLASLLRATLNTSDRFTVTLEEELELVKQYLAIEEARFPDRLRTHIEVPEELRKIEVPVLMLQTLVENAVRHGVANNHSSGKVQVVASKASNAVRLEVIDDGPGVDADMRIGTGLANTRARLQQLYGDRAQLTLSRGATGGTITRVELPA